MGLYLLVAATATRRAPNTENCIGVIAWSLAMLNAFWIAGLTECSRSCLSSCFGSLILLVQPIIKQRRTLRLPKAKVISPTPQRLKSFWILMGSVTVGLAIAENAQIAYATMSFPLSWVRMFYDRTLRTDPLVQSTPIFSKARANGRTKA